MENPGNWQDRVHKTKKNKAKTQHNMCWTSLCTNKNVNITFSASKQNKVNKTCNLPQTTGGKDDMDVNKHERLSNCM